MCVHKRKSHVAKITDEQDVIRKRAGDLGRKVKEEKGKKPRRK